MNEKILAITEENSRIDFKYMATFFKVVHLEKKLGEGMISPEVDLVVIEIEDVSELLNLAKSVRLTDPSMSLLLINGMDRFQRKAVFTQIPGYGQIRFINPMFNAPERVIDFVNSMIHPEYVITSSDVALVIPVYNEEARFQNVLNFYKKIEVLTQKSFINLTVYFVNDGSDDRTQELIDQIALTRNMSTDLISNVSFVNTKRLEVNTRKAGTYIEGIKSIQSDILVIVDADDSFDIDEIAKMINIVRDGYYDMVVGTKDESAEQRPPIRRMMSFFKRQLTHFMLPRGVSDSQTGLKAITGNCARMILPYLHAESELAIDLEMLHVAKKLNFRTLQVKVKCIDQEGSHVSIVRDSLMFLKNIVAISRHHKKLHYTDTRIS